MMKGFISMIFDEVINKYNQLLKANGISKSYHIEQEIVDLLEEFLSHENITEEQKIWALWNISDNYALQRKHEKTYLNHVNFEEYVRSLRYTNPNYMLMLICDTTQRLSLVEGGKSDYWSNLYREIMNNITIDDSNYCVVFEVLRTALYPTLLKYDIEIAEHAINRMKQLVNDYSNDSQSLRFKNLWYCCLLSYNYYKGIHDEDTLLRSYDIFCQLIVHLKGDRIEKNHLFGTYESWNAKRSLWHQARSVHDYIICLIDTENFELAYKCYLEVGAEEFTNEYFIKKIRILENNR